MSRSNRTSLALILGVAGLAAIAAGTDASAHGFGGGRMGGFGGGRMAGFSGARFDGGRVGFGGHTARFTPVRFTPVRFDPGRIGGWHRDPIEGGRNPWRPIHIVHQIPIDNPCVIRHSCGPKLPPRIPCRFHPDLAFCRGWPPIVVRHPPLIGPPVVVGQAPVTLAAVPAPSVAQTTPIAPTCALPGAPIAVVFQPTATASDITAFLASYGAEIGNGPDKDRIYRLRLEDGHLTADQYAQVLQSMRSQTTIVSMVNG